MNTNFLEMSLLSYAQIPCIFAFAFAIRKTVWNRNKYCSNAEAKKGSKRLGKWHFLSV